MLYRLTKYNKSIEDFPHSNLEAQAVLAEREIFNIQG